MKKKTPEMYKRIGAELRLLKSIGSKCFNELALIVPKKDVHKLGSALDKIDALCDDLENYMFRDFPELGKACWKTFSGSIVHYEPSDSTDKEIVTMAKEITDELFKGCDWLEVEDDDGGEAARGV